jgi:hypothetical protein
MENDFISRNKACNGTYSCPTKTDADGYIWVRTIDVAHMIDELTATDVRPVVRGMWIERRFSEDIYGAECSVCHTTWDYGTNFCPNCGADMRMEK